MRNLNCIVNLTLHHIGHRYMHLHERKNLFSLCTETVNSEVLQIWSLYLEVKSYKSVPLAIGTVLQGISSHLRHPHTWTDPSVLEQQVPLGP